MISFSELDIAIIIIFFIVVLGVGFFAKKTKDDAAEFLLSGRKVGLVLFILTNVATWYGGILGVGEFTFNYGLLSWFTQGLPYYIFAIIFAFTFAGKIREASLFTIPDKLESVYGKKVGLISAVIVFVLVSPAPYLLMIGNLIQVIFNLDLIWSLIIASIISSAYLIKGGYKSDLYTDVVQFFVMFAGFIIIVAVSVLNFGGVEFLKSNLPVTHLKPFGSASPVFVIVWFLIALWTFADPGFHQRCYSAKKPSTAKYGILLSVLLWLLFDFLTTTTGLFAKAVLPGDVNPVMSFPLYAEKILGSGLKGVFFAALFATIISTANSFLFISGTTFGRDLIYKMSKQKNENKIVFYTRLGIFLSALIAIIMAYSIQSVISLWYLVGSVFIPAIIFLIFGAYYEKLKIPQPFALIEMIAAITASVVWLLVKNNISNWLMEVEPMVVGLIAGFTVHLLGLLSGRFLFKEKRKQN